MLGLHLVMALNYTYTNTIVLTTLSLFVNGNGDT